ncbi:MAG: hypothetical protein V4732_22895 [Pseudomonadota bacterium]
MNNTYVLVFEFIIVITLVLAQLFDVYALMVRAKVNVENSSQVLGVSSWIQYLARIMNLISLFPISFLLEKKIGEINIPNLFICSMFIGLFTMIFLSKIKFSAQVMFFLQMLGFSGVFGVFGKKKYWWKVQFYWFSKVTFFSAAVSVLVNASLFVPFLLSIKYPEFRMTLAYSAQIFSFFAAVISFTYLERKFYKSLDAGDEFVCASQMITGKLMAQIILIIILFSII